MKEDVLKIIFSVCKVDNNGHLNMNHPLCNQTDIDSLDCAEIELEIQSMFGIKFESGEVVNINNTPNQILENIQKQLDAKNQSLV